MAVFGWVWLGMASYTQTRQSTILKKGGQALTKVEPSKMKWIDKFV